MDLYFISFCPECQFIWLIFVNYFLLTNGASERMRRFLRLFDAGMLLISIFLRFLGGVKIDTVVFAGKLGAVCAVDDHGIAVANERRVLSGRGLTAGGICRNGQFRTVGDDDNLALCIGAVNRRVQRLQPRQHVRAGVSIVVVRSDADDRYGGLHSGQKSFR